MAVHSESTIMTEMKHSRKSEELLLYFFWFLLIENYCLITFGIDEGTKNHDPLQILDLKCYHVWIMFMHVSLVLILVDHHH